MIKYIHNNNGVVRVIGGCYGNSWVAIEFTWMSQHGSRVVWCWSTILFLNNLSNRMHWPQDETPSFCMWKWKNDNYQWQTRCMQPDLATYHDHCVASLATNILYKKLGLLSCLSCSPFFFFFLKLSLAFLFSIEMTVSKYSITSLSFHAHTHLNSLQTKRESCYGSLPPNI